MQDNIRKSKEMMQSLLSKQWEVETPVIDKDGKIIIPQPTQLFSCLRKIEKLFLTIASIIDGKGRSCIKDQLLSIRIDIENITEAIESAYVIPSREFLVDQLKDALDIIEEQEKEMDDDSEHYKKLMARIEKRFGEDVADSIYWDRDDRDSSSKL